VPLSVQAVSLRDPRLREAPGQSCMDELRESSLLFSLEGLLETERERVQREAREAERRREDELARVAQLAERRRIAAQQEREARERRETLERERERLESERLEAMKRATVERARIEAEAELRLIEVEQARKHELSLVKLREQERAAHYRTVSFIACGACASSIVLSCVVHFGFVAPAHASSESGLKATIARERERLGAVERALAAERKRSQELALAAERAAEAAAKAPVATESQRGLPKPSQPHVTPPARPPTTTPCVDNGDPLNPCLRAGKRR
jgi:hypothetical protein